jgi:RNA polymerase sigma-70 factor, ECF subfamily
MVDTADVRGARNDAFERLYAEHAQALFGFLRYRTGDAALAEDLLADTYERALRARRRFDPRKASEKTWLYAIALNRLNDHVRHRAGESRALERITAGPSPGSIGDPWGIDETDPLEEISDRGLDGDADRDLLNRCLAILDGPERETIALRFGAEMSIAEIAELTGEQPATIERRVYRALRRLREALG